MKIGPRMNFCLLASLILMTFACSPSPAAPSPEVSATMQPTFTATVAPVIESPTSTAGVSIESGLKQEEILQIVRSSLAAYPWRLRQSVLVKGTQQTTTSLTEVQSSTRGYNQSMQIVGGEPITIESILIDSMLYLKLTGSLAEKYGLVDGQWTIVPPDSQLAQLSDMSAVDPVKIAEIFATDFASISSENGIDELFFDLVGSEELNGISTDIYESKGETFTYRWWVGVDGRFYKSIVDVPAATRTILVEYDPGIAVQPPIP